MATQMSTPDYFDIFADTTRLLSDVRRETEALRRQCFAAATLVTSEKHQPRPRCRKFAGLEIMVENPKGSIRSGVSKSGKRWAVKMNADYGYLKKANGEDGEGLDIFVGHDPKAENIYVVHQNNPATGRYDEDKLVCGVSSAAEAKALYLSNYDTPKFFRSVTEIPLATFKQMLTKAEPGSVRWKRKMMRDVDASAMFSDFDAGSDVEGRWVTMGAHRSADGKKHGGAHVFIKNNHVAKGPPALEGKTPQQIEQKPRKGGVVRPVEWEFQNAARLGRLTLPTENGKLDPNLEDAYRRAAQKASKNLGKFTIDPVTGHASALITPKFANPLLGGPPNKNHPLYDHGTGTVVGQEDAGAHAPPTNEEELAQAVGRGDIPLESVLDSHPHLAGNALIEMHRQEKMAELEKAKAEQEAKEQQAAQSIQTPEGQAEPTAEGIAEQIAPEGQPQAPAEPLELGDVRATLTKLGIKKAEANQLIEAAVAAGADKSELEMITWAMQHRRGNANARVYKPEGGAQATAEPGQGGAEAAVEPQEAGGQVATEPVHQSPTPRRPLPNRSKPLSDPQALLHERTQKLKAQGLPTARAAVRARMELENEGVLPKAQPKQPAAQPQAKPQRQLSPELQKARDEEQDLAEKLRNGQQPQPVQPHAGSESQGNLQRHAADAGDEANRPTDAQVDRAAQPAAGGQQPAVQPGGSERGNAPAGEEGTEPNGGVAENPAHEPEHATEPHQPETQTQPPVEQPEPARQGAGKGKAAPKNKPMSRSAIEKVLLSHLAETSGESEQDIEDDKALAPYHSPYTFLRTSKTKSGYPGEIEHFLEHGGKRMRRLFNLTDDPAKAQGDDAMRDLGQDKYLGLVERRSDMTGRMRKALDAAKNSPDPQMQLLAAIHDTFQKGPKEAVKAADLQPGEEMTINSIPVEVTENEDGERVLQDGGDIPAVPVDALDGLSLPVDKGSRHEKPVAELDDPFGEFLGEPEPEEVKTNAEQKQQAASSENRPWNEVRRGEAGSFLGNTPDSALAARLMNEEVDRRVGQLRKRGMESDGGVNYLDAVRQNVEDDLRKDPAGKLGSGIRQAVDKERDRLASVNDVESSFGKEGHENRLSTIKAGGYPGERSGYETPEETHRRVVQEALNGGKIKNHPDYPDLSASRSEPSAHEKALAENQKQWDAMTPKQQRQKAGEIDDKAFQRHLQKTREVPAEEMGKRIEGEKPAAQGQPPQEQQAQKSKGHVGYFTAPDGQKFELYRQADGSLHRAPLSSVIDVTTGNRIGRWESSPATAEQRAKALMNPPAEKPQANATPNTDVSSRAEFLKTMPKISGASFNRQMERKFRREDGSISNGYEHVEKLMKDGAKPVTQDTMVKLAPKRESEIQGDIGMLRKKAMNDRALRETALPQIAKMQQAIDSGYEVVPQDYIQEPDGSVTQLGRHELRYAKFLAAQGPQRNIEPQTSAPAAPTPQQANLNYRKPFNAREAEAKVDRDMAAKEKKARQQIASERKGGNIYGAMNRALKNIGNAPAPYQPQSGVRNVGKQLRERVLQIQSAGKQAGKSVGFREATNQAKRELGLPTDFADVEFALDAALAASERALRFSQTLVAC